MAELYMIVQHGKPIVESVPVFSQFESAAIEKAKELAVATREPHQVFALELIGCSTVPASKWADYRDAPSAGEKP